MDKFLIDVFRGQIKLQCQFVVASALEINSGLQNRRTQQVFYALQNLLNASANISKALWGAGGKKADERKALREHLGVQDDSPLREVTMRNNFEHIDERILHWAANSKLRHYVDICYGPKGSFETAEPIDAFRVFETDTTNLVFWGQEFNVNRIVEATEDLLDRIVEIQNREFSPFARPFNTAN
ncbi:hypothetical protein [Mycoplana rhizolycopersici]|uniref:Uncharacterized protein n=1 Tax=Mycoplana rhizolycopersici TaxID=2746702 RepID=A0ABX2QDY7_9HYPH|nr:hypothetical protein [Rhizobium rhizolycopersici]NVP55977.1 hypothetical protein [Rhizobium rhizolycopersici]